MKIRQGFVSNSSSSSFIISAKPTLSSIKVEIEFKDFKRIDCLEEYYEYKKDFDEYDESKDEHLPAIKAAFARGEALYVGDVATDDSDPASQYLCNNGFPKSKEYKIIQDAEF